MGPASEFSTIVWWFTEFFPEAMYGNFRRLREARLKLIKISEFSPLLSFDQVQNEFQFQLFNIFVTNVILNKKND